MNTSRFVLVGVGNIGRRFLEILDEKQSTLRECCGVELTLVAAVDSSGAALQESGLDLQRIVELKRSGGGVAAYPEAGVRGLTALAALEQAHADLLIELSPTNLEHGEPGLSAVTWALEHDMDVVLANKGPMVLAYPRLTALAAERNRSLLFSATVAGGLPTVNIGHRDLIAAKILRVEGIFNATTNYILTRMESGLSFEQALMEAQKTGAAEADPTLDVDGWDAANKLVIVANSALRMPATLRDISVQGIRGLTREQLLAAKERGHVIKLLATAEPSGTSGYKLAVKPTELPLEHPLARLTKWQMGVVYTTDINGTIIAIIEEEGTLATAGAVLRDVVNTLMSRR